MGASRAWLLSTFVIASLAGCFDDPGMFAEDGPEPSLTETSGSDGTDTDTGDTTDGTDTDTGDTGDSTTGEFECGDGTVQAGEECDDGNTNELDACTTLCTPPVPPVLELSFSQVKQFDFDWDAVL